MYHPPPLWNTFSPPARHDLIVLWTDLLQRHLQAQRLAPTGGPDGIVGVC